MIELDRFYNAALANPSQYLTLESVQGGGQGEVPRNIPRSIRPILNDEREQKERQNNRELRDKLMDSIVTNLPALAPNEIADIRSKLGIGANGASDSPLESNVVTSVIDEAKARHAANTQQAVSKVVDMLAAADREINSILDAIKGVAVSESVRASLTDMTIQSFEQFRSTVQDSIRAVYADVKTTWEGLSPTGDGLSPTGDGLSPTGETPESLESSLAAVRDLAKKSADLVRKASIDPTVSMQTLYVEFLLLLGSVTAACGVLSFATSALKAMKIVVEARLKEDVAGTKESLRVCKERIEEMLEELDEKLAELKRKILELLAQRGRQGRKGAFSGRTVSVGGAEGGSVFAAMTQSAQRQLEDVEKLVVGAKAA